VGREIHKCEACHGEGVHRYNAHATGKTCFAECGACEGSGRCYVCPHCSGSGLEDPDDVFDYPEPPEDGPDACDHCGAFGYIPAPGPPLNVRLLEQVFELLEVSE
jgi:hypothetical protein